MDIDYNQLLPVAAGLPFTTVGLVLYLLTTVGLWRVFTKAGYAGILALIPLVNIFVLVLIAGYSPFAVLLYLIPIVNVIFAILVALRIGEQFGKGGLFSVFFLWLWPFVGYPVIGLSAASYAPARGTE